jgi:hypothetical protein
VTSEVSRILWYYYNDSVSLPLVTYVREPTLIPCNTAHPILLLRRERALFCLPLPHEMGTHTYRAWCLLVMARAAHLARVRCDPQCVRLCGEERYQCRTALEGLEDPGRSGSCGACACAGGTGQEGVIVVGGRQTSSY